MNSKDDLVVLHEFSTGVVLALEKAGVRPVGEHGCFLMAMVVSDESENPIGCSFNWNEETETWDIAAQATESQPYVE